MTDREIMAIAHEDLVRLFVLRRDDLNAASKEAARIARNELRKDPAYKAYHAEYFRMWQEANKERRKAYMKQWTAANREKANEYLREWRRKKALDKQPAGISESTSLQVHKSTSLQVNESTSQQVNESASQQVNKSTSQRVNESTSLQVNESTSQRVNKSERMQTGVTPMPDYELTQVRTDSEAAAYWQSVIDDLEYRFFAKEIDVETYFGGRNAAMSHLLAAEERMKPRRLRNY